MIPQPYQKWSTAAFAFAALCLAAIALAKVFGIATPTVNGVFMAGIVVAGTAAWIIQARQTCPHCGKPYGWGFRIVKAHLCRHCGGDFRG